MASGGGPPRKSSSESRSQRTWKRSNSTADGDDNASMTSNPLDARPNNWDFSDWQPSSAFEAGKRRKKAKANPEREREKERERERERSLSQDSSPQATEKQHRTPSTFPRTRGNPASQKLALENLRQHMTFSDLEDQLSNDGERNNARKVTMKRERPPNYTRQDMSSSNTRRHGSAGDARPTDNRNNNKDDQGPDTNHIVSRLMQIRDYIKQASSMMDTLQKSPDPTEAQKATKLAPVIASLKEQEHAYLDLLRKLWALRDEASAAENNPNDARNMVRVKTDPLDETASVDLDVRSEVSDATTEHTQSSSSRPRIEDKLGVDSDSEVRSQGSQNDQNRTSSLPARLPSWDYEASRYESEDVQDLASEAANALSEKKNELAMLKEQEDLLRKLVEQQEQLRALQGKQESLLALQKEAETKLKQAKGRREQAEVSPHVAEPQPPNIPAEPLSDSENVAAAQAEILPELQNLRHRLDYLKKNIYDVKSEATTGEPIEVNRNPDGSISDAGRKQLQDKLQELQNKKKRMDDLVSELQGLKSMRVEQLLQNPDDILGDAEASGITLGALGDGMASGSGTQTVGETEELMEVVETQNKLKKLQEVRSRLNQLRQLVGYFQADGSPDSPTDQVDQSSVPGYSDTEDLDVTVQTLRRSPQVNVVNQNVDMGTPATDRTDSQMQSDDENMPPSDTTDTESRTSSLGPWGDDPEIQEKVKKLKAAKDKLRQLQNLVTTFQQNPESAGLLPDELAELATSLDEEMEAALPGSSAIASAAVRAELAAQDIEGNSSSAMSDGELPQHSNDRSESEYQAKMQTQLKELHNLKDEREKLLAIRDQLRMLHQGLPNQVNEEEEPVRRPDRNNTEVKFAPEPQIQTTQSVTFSSNDELYDRMRKQRILREELRQKKRELEAIMRKDRPKKQYSRNQDNQSDTVSYSTEAFGTSVVSADATMATWGGSTVENLESITEDEDNSQEDQEDEDGYPLDGIIQVEEEEEENEESGETYTIEQDVRQRREARQQQQQQRGQKTKRKGDYQSFPRPLGDMTGASRSQKQTGYGRAKLQNSSKTNRSRKRQGNYRSPEDIVEEDENRDRLEVLQRQLETTNSICQSLLHDQQSLYQMLREGYNSPAGMNWSSTSPFRQGLFQDPYALPPPLQQQQQMMFKLNQCYQQMTMQQAEMQSLQHQLQCLSLQMNTPPNAEGRTTAGDPSNSKLSPVTPAFGLNPYQTPFFNSGQPSSFSLNPQFPASFSFLSNPNAYASASGIDLTGQLGGSRKGNKADQGGGDTKAQSDSQVPKDFSLNNNRPSPSRSATTKTSKRSNALQGSHTINAPASWSVAEEQGSTKISSDNVPRLNLERIMASRREAEGQSFMTSTERGNSSREQSGVVGRVYSSSGRATAAANLASKKRNSDPYRPGLSSGISGTAHVDSASVSSAVSSVAGMQNTRNRDAESNADLSLFNALRENIYAEVATLISQNENRPHFLIDLFKELQLLSTDFLRTTTLFSIRELVSRYLTDENGGSANEPLPTWATQTGATNSELTPSESLLTSDEEDFNALRRMREYEQQKTETEHAEKVRLLTEKQSGAHKNKSKSKTGRLEENTEVQSDSSTSDVPHPRIDTQQLDQQIKSIMTEVIPIIKEHMDDVCSPQLLSYIKRVVVSLTKQENNREEFARFFNRQLGSILQDSLVKFEGRKLRECGEDLLVEMSEVLFNELAFCRLLRDLDDPSVAAIHPRFGGAEEASAIGSGHRIVNYDSDSSGDEESDSSSPVPEETPLVGAESRQPIQATTYEEEELGKARDDEMAKEVQIQDADEKDEDLESQFQSVIELAVSETKPFTRIGSDEDDDGSDESLSAEDPSETAVSRDAKLELTTSIQLTDGDGQPNKGEESTDVTGDITLSTDTNLQQNGEVTQLNGFSENSDASTLMNGEVTLEDLPVKLNVLSEVELNAQLAEDEKANSDIQTMCDVTGPELAGDGQALKEPESST